MRVLKTASGPAFVLAIALAACGGGTLTEAGARVKLMTAAPPAGCTEVAGVSGDSIGPDYQGRNKNKLRNQAAEKEATYVRLEQNHNNGNAAGTAFVAPTESDCALIAVTRKRTTSAIRTNELQRFLSLPT